MDPATIGWWRAMGTVGILTALSWLAMWDRYATAGVLGDLEEYFDISDTAGGLLQTAYIAVYVVYLLVLGFLGDRFNRKRLIEGSVCAWILVSLASSFIPSDMFWLFVVTRSLASVGLSSLSCLAAPFFTSYFDDAARSYSLMIFYISLPVGASCGISFGSLVSLGLDVFWCLRVPTCLAIPFLLLSLFVIRDPLRDEKKAKEESREGVINEVTNIFKVKTFSLATASSLMQNFYICAFSWWLNSYVSSAMDSEREEQLTDSFHGFALPAVMWMSSILAVIAGIIGTSTLITIVEKWRSGSRCLPASPLSPVSTSCLFLSLVVPFLFLTIFSPRIDIFLMVISNFFSTFLWGGVTPAIVSIIMEVIVPSRRATATALFNVLMSVTGDGPAPFIVGALSDFFQGGLASSNSRFVALQKGLYIAVAVDTVSIPLMAACLFVYRRDVAHAKEEEQLLRGTQGDGWTSESLGWPSDHSLASTYIERF